MADNASGPTLLITRTAGTERAKGGLPHTLEEKDTMLDHPYHFRNFSNKLLINWDIVTALGFILAEITGTTCFLFAQETARYWFGGAGNAFVAAWIVANAVFFVKLFFGKWTSTPLDLWRSIANTFTFILTRGTDMGFWELWLELFKLVIIVICQWLASLISISLMGASTGTIIKTSSAAECLDVPTPAACVIYPVLSGTSTTTSLGWQEALGAIIIYGAYVAGERFFGFVKLRDIFGNALVYAAGHFFVYLMWGFPSGGSFNFWYITSTAWFSGLTENIALYIWPAVTFTMVVAAVEVVVFYTYVYWLRREEMKARLKGE